jgi:integrase
MAKRRGHGERSIYQRKDGRWAASLELGWVDGRRKRKTVYGKTRREVSTRLDEARRADAEGRPLPGDRQTLGSFLDWWIRDHVPGRVGARTLPSYAQKVKHIKRLLGHVPLLKLTSTQIESAFNQLVAEGHSPGGVRAIRAVFRTAIREAERKGMVSRNVVALADGPKVRRRDKDPFTVNEVHAIRSKMEADRLMPLFFVGLALGLREGEAFGLRWDDVDLDQGTLVVSKQIQRVAGGYEFVDLKTEASRATLELTPGQVAMLKAHRRRLVKERMLAGSEWEDLNLVFPTPRGTPLDASNVRRYFHRICDQAQVRRRRIHDWRVTAASWLADLGVHPDTAKQVTRHAQASTLMEFYTKASSDSRKKAIEDLDRLFNG